jgi:predicted regulator of Ras-like GTPase activity (Roadblock/LC7/MglB family)
LFTNHIKNVVENVEGGMGGLIMGLDGIAVDSYVRSDQHFDITTMGMEFSFILGQVKKAGESLRVGALSEFAVKAESMTMVVRMLTEEYFMAVVLAAEGNFGKCRFLMRLAEPKLVAEL